MASTNIKPLLPFVSLEQILSYRTDQPDTYTSSPLVNAVCDAIIATHSIEAKELSEYLQVDGRKLSSALQLITGLSLHTLLQEYCLNAMQQCVAEHPDWTLNQVAQHIGYANAMTLWRFSQRATGMTPTGQKSQAGTERWTELRNKLRAKSSSQQ